MRTTVLNRSFLLLILALAFALRSLSALFLTGSIDPEGAEYARIAENLLNGIGYVGIAIPGTELMFPPLFPFLIGAVSLVAHQAEFAGRLISVVMGTLLVLPVFFIASKLYNDTAAYISAALVACHPMLIGYASTVFSESTYITLVLSGAYFSLQCLSLPTARRFLLAGIFFGLAYLTRPEAALYPLLTIAFVVAVTFVMKQQQVGQIARQTLLLLGAFLVLAAPYVTWLSVQSGQLRWEGKTPINYAVASAMIGGKSLDEADFSISSDLREQGIANRPNAIVFKSTKQISVWEVIHTVSLNELQSVRAILNIIGSRSFGSPILVLLGILGLFGKPRTLVLTISQFYIILVSLGVPFLSFAVSPGYIATRYLCLFLPVLIIWASNGVMLLSRWASERLKLLEYGGLTAKKVRIGVGLFTCVALLLIALLGVRQVTELTAYDYHKRPVKQAGEWLAASFPGAKTVVDGTEMVAFHAGASLLWFPYSDSTTALNYISKKRPDFIVFREYALSTAPYVKDWFEHGIPDRRAQLIYDKTTAKNGRILIYRWDYD
jgi:4-amino-4-deoxy-L-arabinose transferase-like glycosyltransferase